MTKRVARSRKRDTPSAAIAWNKQKVNIRVCFSASDTRWDGLSWPYCLVHALNRWLVDSYNCQPSLLISPQARVVPGVCNPPKRNAATFSDRLVFFNTTCRNPNLGSMPWMAHRCSAISPQGGRKRPTRMRRAESTMLCQRRYGRAIGCSEPCTATDTKTRKQHSNSKSSWGEKSRKRGRKQIGF